MKKVAPPQLTLRIGTVVECLKKRHKWVFMGYRRTTVSTQLVFIDADEGWAMAEYRVVNATTMEQKFPGITQLSKTQAHVRAILDISTAHVRKETAELLDAITMTGIDAPVIAHAKGEYGWLVYVSDDPSAQPNWSRVPVELQRLILFARRMGCDWIMFDRDGVVLEDFETWDW